VGSVRLLPILLEEMLMYLKSPTPIREIFFALFFFAILNILLALINIYRG
jgi:hypothetical protein